MLKKKPLAFLLLLLFGFGIIFWFLFDTHILNQDQFGNILTGESTYGDLPFHLSTISQIAFGKVFPPQNPFLAGAPLVYPYLIDLLSAFLVNLGLSLRLSIITPGMFFSLLMVTLLFIFYRKVSKSDIVGFISTILFLLNGGLGFYFFFRDVVYKGLLGQYLRDPRHFPDYSHLFGENIQWNNFTSRILVPERSVLLGIPMGLVILYLLFLGSHKNKIWSLVVAALITGLLPLSHTHTFLTFALVIPILTLTEIKKKNFTKWLAKWAFFGGIVLVIAIPQLLIIFNHVGESSGFVKFHLGWMAKPGFGEFLVFWLKNAGVLIFLMLIALFLKRVSKFSKLLVIISFLILILVNLFIFQPYNWDNIKFLFWVSVFGALAAGEVLVTVWHDGKFAGKVFSVLLFLALTSSAVISLYREIDLHSQLFSSEDVQLGQWVRRNTASSSIFLTAPIHNSFVSNFGGRRIVMGYPGLLWVHGINYLETERNLKEIYKGSYLSASLIKQENINYIVLGPEEINVLHANVDYFENNYCLVMQSSNYKIFSVDNCSHRR